MNSYYPFLKNIELQLGGFRDKVILDVGCELAGHLIRCLVDDFGARSAIGINPQWASQDLGNGCSILSGDIRKTAFATDSIDLIISSCAFEHIPNLDQALHEMHRILKPGGYVYSHHGPLWSTTYGHHVHIAAGTYWNLILPPWCHLLMLETELAAWLQGKYDPATIRQILDWVYRDAGQNRLMFSDHARLYEQSPFEVCYCTGYTHDELNAKYEPLVTHQMLQDLRSRYPNQDGFFYDGIRVLMRKRT